MLPTSSDLPMFLPMFGGSLLADTPVDTSRQKAQEMPIFSGNTVGSSRHPPTLGRAISASICSADLGEAFRTLKRGSERMPTYRSMFVWLVAAAAMADHMDDARQAATIVTTQQPSFTIRNLARFHQAARAQREALGSRFAPSWFVPLSIADAVPPPLLITQPREATSTSFPLGSGNEPAATGEHCAPGVGREMG